MKAVLRRRAEAAAATTSSVQTRRHLQGAGPQESTYSGMSPTGSGA